MVDLFHFIHSMPDFVSHHSHHSVHDFISNHILPYIDEDTLDTVGDAAGGGDEIAEMMKEHAKKSMDAGEKMVGKKNEQIAVMSSFVLVPIALIVGAFVLKVIYDSFTKTADKVGQGVKSATSRIKSAIIDKEALNDGGKGSPPKDPSKTQKRRLLLGEILKRFVVPTLGDAEIENAITAQKEMKQAKKIGEILLEQGHISIGDVAQAVKIQEKRG